MDVSQFRHLVIFLSVLLGCSTICAQNINTEISDFNALSEQFLTNIKKGHSTSDIRTQLYQTTLEDLEEGLGTDREKLAFWINIYNAYIQVLLSENPALYRDRDAFFENERIPLAGRMVSFDKIEHGIIRRSQWKLGGGIVRKWFPDEFERALRVEEPDYRIHFALNCGAIDCPPVAIYRPEILERQFETGAKSFLQRVSEYSPTKGEVRTTPLFSWFRGDFGFESGVKDILLHYGIIPRTEQIDVTYKEYDWTLDLDNFTFEF